MEREETDRADELPARPEGPKNVKRLGRTWAERFEHPVKFRHYSGIDGGGRRRIFFKFDLPDGQTKLDPEVAEIIAGLKLLNDRPTDLKFERDKSHGKVYRLPDTHQGRTVAELLTARLLELGRRKDREHGRGP